MKIENQVCTLEQATRLKELGIVQESLFHHGLWYNGDSHDNVIRVGRAAENKRFQYAAFTVAELGAMLPLEVRTGRGIMNGEDYCLVSVESPLCYKMDKCQPMFSWNYFKTEAIGRAALLIYLLENKLITPEEVNHRLTH